MSTDAGSEERPASAPTRTNEPAPARWGRAAVFQAAAQALNRGSAILILALLVRRLPADEIALVAALAVAVSWVETIAGGGLVDAVVFFPDDRRHRVAAREVAIGLALVLGCAFLLGAPMIARVLDQSSVAEFRVIGISVVFLTFAALGDGRLRQRLDFGRRAGSEFGRATARIVVALVVLAYDGGAWAFVAAVLAGDAVFLCGVALLATRRVQKVALGRVPVRPVLRYALIMGGALVLARLVLDVDYVMIATRQGAEALTTYFLAFRVVELAILGLLAVASAVAFPLYRQRLTDSLESLHVTYLAVLRLQSLLGAVIGLLIVLHAEVIVELLFGQGWEAAVTVLVWLGVYGAGRSFGAGAVDAYKTIGRPEYAAGIAVARFVVLVPVLFVAAGVSVESVAKAQAITAFLFAALMQAAAASVLRLRGARIARAYVPAVVAVAAVLTAHGLATVLTGFTGGRGLVVAVDLCIAAAVVLVPLRREKGLLDRGAARPSSSAS